MGICYVKLMFVFDFYLLYYTCQYDKLINIIYQEICHAVGVFDLDHVIPKLQRSTKACEAYPRLEQVKNLYLLFCFRGRMSIKILTQILPA